MNLHIVTRCDIITQGAIMSILKDAYDVLKDIKNLAEKVKSKPVIDKVLELQSMFFEIREENESLKKEIEKYKNIDEVNKNIKITEDGYYEVEGVPHCITCWQKDRKVISLQKPVLFGAGIGGMSFMEGYSCPVCKREY